MRIGALTPRPRPPACWPCAFPRHPRQQVLFRSEHVSRRMHPPARHRSSPAPVHYLRPYNGFGDWFSIGDETPKELIATALFAHSAQLTAHATRLLGKDAKPYDTLAGCVRTAFRKKYVLPDGWVRSDTPTAYVLALTTPCWKTGGLAYRLLLQISFPSCGYQIGKGPRRCGSAWTPFVPTAPSRTRASTRSTTTPTAPTASGSTRTSQGLARQRRGPGKRPL